MNDYRDYIAHFGVLGMKWGVRRYQNPDGSLTDAGRKHYQKEFYKQVKDIYKDSNKSSQHEEESRQKATNIVEQKVKDTKEFKNAVDCYKQLKDFEKTNTGKYDFFDSDERDKLSRKAYEQTYKYFQEKEPDNLKEMLDAVGGRKENLIDVHGFRKTFEGFEDEAWQKGEEEFYNKNKDTVDAYNNLLNQRTESIKNLANSMIGKYGNRTYMRYSNFSNEGVPTSYKNSLESILFLLSRQYWS